MIGRPIEVLLVEDSPSDAELTVEAFRLAKMRNHTTVVEDGVAALQFLRREGRYAGALRPDIILLDLNLPRKDGREVLAEIKADPSLATIPVVVLTASTAEHDFFRAAEFQANSYITKPVDFIKFMDIVQEIESFHILVVNLPPIPGAGDAFLAGAWGPETLGV